MQFGNGALVFQGLPTPPVPPGPPFPANSAVDGCSIDPVTGQIVWGNDVGLLTAILLKDRELPMGAFKVTWLRGANRQFQVDPVTHRYFIGDRDNSAGGIYFAIDSPAKTVKVFDQGNAIPDLLMDFTNQLYFFGSSGLGFPSGLSLDNTANQEIDLLLSGNSYLRLNSGPFLTYAMGDLDAANNNSRITVDDTQSNFKFDNSVGNYLAIIPPLITGGSIYSIGDDPTSDGIFSITGGTNAKTASIQLGNGGLVMKLDRTLGVYQFGDVALASNGQMLWIDDASTAVSVLGDVFGVNNGTTIQVDDLGTIIGLFAQAGVVITGTGPANMLTITGDTTLIHTGTTLSNNAGANVGTLTNAPTVGNPSKWIAIDDNGTTRKIPTWL